MTEGDEGDEDGAESEGEQAGQSGMQGQGRSWKGGGSGEGMTPEELAELLFKSLISADAGLMNVVARNAVDRYAGMEPGRPVGGTYYLYRTLRNLDLDAVLERLMGQAQAGAAGGSLTELEERLAADEFKARIEKFRRAVETEIRRRLVEDRGAEALARSVRKPLPEDIDVMHATREELAMLHRVLQPLSRKLAVRLARKRRHGRKGPLDFRATMRRSLSTGGVPIEPRFRHPRPAKPEIFVVADISGSVASFARFTLHLVYAISSQFSKVRSFVFVDGIDEVTRFFEGVVDPAEAVARINTEADVIWVDGHSDYGHALERVPPALGRPGDVALERHGARGRPQQLPRLGFVGARGPPGQGAPRLLAQPRAHATTGGRATPSWASTPPTATTWWSAGHSGSSSISSGTWRERRASRRARAGTPRGVLRIFPPAEGASRIVLVRHGEAQCNLDHVVGGLKGCTGLTDLGRRQVAVLADRLYESGELRDATALYSSVLPACGGDRGAAAAGGRARDPRRSGRSSSAATCASCTRASATACPGRRWSRRSGCPTGTATRASPSRRGARAGPSSSCGPPTRCVRSWAGIRGSWWSPPCTPA